jgi:hypothetical protein
MLKRKKRLHAGKTIKKHPDFVPGACFRSKTGEGEARLRENFD